MNRSRIVILGVAIFAAIGAGYIARSMSSQPAEPVAETAAKPPVETRDVLLVAQKVDMGERLGTALKWQEWPVTLIDDSFITREKQPDALDELQESIARYTLYPGEPVRRERLVPGGQTLMSALLTPGMRAVAVEISPETSAGGFILPGDHVDLIMTRRSESENGSVTYITETVLENIRVLAIDQKLDENEDGQPAIIGETATLEVTPEQAEVVTVAQRMADRLTLALRSLADYRQRSSKTGRHLISGSHGNAIRFIKTGEVSYVGAPK